MPIYYVITEDIRQPNLIYTVRTIIKVIETTLEEAPDLYDKEIALLQYGTGRYFQVFYFLREPPNPFRESEKR